MTLSTALVNASITSFEAILAANPRELEMVCGAALVPSAAIGSQCTVHRIWMADGVN